MKIKSKLILSLLFLFGVIILVGGLGSYYLQMLAKESALILRDNERSLQYMRQIEESVDHLVLQKLTALDTNGFASRFSQIRSVMEYQKSNLTEQGERELTERLDKNLQEFKSSLQTSAEANTAWLALHTQIKEQTATIYLLNQQSMTDKNKQASGTAKRVVLYMRILVGVSVLIGLVFIFSLPGYISKPLETFNRSIQEIAKGNYKVTIQRKSGDEYGQLAKSFNTMAAKLEEYESSSVAKLLMEQKRMAEVVNHFDEVVLGLDENKMILFANAHCTQLLNLNKDEIIGRYAPDIAVTNSLMNSLIKELMVDFEPWEEKIYDPIKVVEGRKEKIYTKKIIEILEQPTGEQRKVLVGHLILLADITDFSERDKAKTHFMAVLSHELKTPVSAIQMSTSLIRNPKSGQLSEKQVELLETIDRNNDRIRHMINEILDLSKIESGSIDVNRTEEVVHELIARAIDGVRPFLEEKNLSIREDLPNSLPLVRVDAHKTVWILNNFLTNAIRYAPRNSEIVIVARMEGEGLKISVSDSGKGISPENQQRIFEKFTRVKQSGDSGTGLGLAISKEFIQAMGGSIGVVSKQGEGATFWIRV